MGDSMKWAYEQEEEAYEKKYGERVTSTIEALKKKEKV